MGRQNNIKSLFIAVIMLIWHTPSSCQDNNLDQKIGTVYFIGEKAKLTKNAKATLDSCVKQIQNHSSMHVQVISYNKDFCEQCGDISWKRAQSVLRYLSKRGISKDRLTFSNQLDGELNKVDLLLVTPIRKDISRPKPQKYKTEK